MTNAATESRALQLVDRGYHRLLSFECQNPSHSPPRLGYEWFGGTAPPHEALTAYGLMLFRDLTRVYDQVDRDMLDRTRQFLLKPADFGFDRADSRDLAGAEPETAAKEAVRILRGERGPKREMLLANAAGGIYVSGKVDSLLEALPLAVEALDSGRAFETLRTFVKATGGNLSKVEDDGHP